jgi:hypothetical protein
MSLLLNSKYPFLSRLKFFLRSPFPLSAFQFLPFTICVSSVQICCSNPSVDDPGGTDPHLAIPPAAFVVVFAFGL